MFQKPFKKITKYLWWLQKRIKRGGFLGKRNMVSQIHKIVEVQPFTFENRLAYSKCKSFKSWLSSDHRVLIKPAICYL